MGIIGRQEESMFPRAIGRRRDRNYRTRTDERTKMSRDTYTHARTTERRETKKRSGEHELARIFCAAFAGPVPTRYIRVYTRVNGWRARYSKSHL